MKILIDLYQQIVDTVLEYVVGTLLSSLLIFVARTLELYMTANIHFMLFLLISGWILSVYLGIRLFTYRKKFGKKLINNIAIDKNGNCHCPICYHFMPPTPHKDPTLKQLQLYCQKCNKIRIPITDKGEIILIDKFCAFQKQRVLNGKKPSSFIT